MNLALLDFDGTISTRDSFLLFLQHTGKLKFYRVCTARSPQIALYLMGKYPNQKLKESFLTALFKQEPISGLQDTAELFCRELLPGIIRSQAAERIRWHQGQGDRVCVVTATPRIILEPWCATSGLDIIGSELEVDENGRVTGRLLGKNCRAEEKVRRITSTYQLQDYQGLYAYGDTSGDQQMLELAPPENRFFKPFRTKD